MSCKNSDSEDQSIQQDVVPVGFDFDGDYLYVGGMNVLKSTKYKNILKNSNVAIVVDDSRTIDPWDPRGIRIYLPLMQLLVKVDIWIRHHIATFTISE